VLPPCPARFLRITDAGCVPIVPNGARGTPRPVSPGRGGLPPHPSRASRLWNFGSGREGGSRSPTVLPRPDSPSGIRIKGSTPTFPSRTRERRAPSGRTACR
jgi:hypothetical protein